MTIQIIAFLLALILLLLVSMAAHAHKISEIVFKILWFTVIYVILKAIIPNSDFNIVGYIVGLITFFAFLQFKHKREDGDKCS